jgi:hypothetical protein
LVALCRNGQVQQVTWELSAATRAGLAEGASLEIEWTTFTPAWAGPIRHTEHIVVQGAAGNVVAAQSPRISLVSAVLGVRAGGKLIPLTTLRQVEVGG